MTRSPTVLLLVDFLNFMGFEEADALAPHALRAAGKAAALKARLKRAGVTAIYANDNFGRWESDIRGIVEACLERGGASRRLAELIAPGDDDRAVLKPRHSAFFGTPLEFLLDEFRARQLVIAGLTTDQCVMFTAHDAYLRGYALWVPPDCVAAITPRYSREALAHMQRVLKARIDTSRVSLTKGWPRSGQGHRV